MRGSKTPSSPEDNQEENEIMHSWDHRQNTRESGLMLDRSRESQFIKSVHESPFDIPREWWPAGYQLYWCAETMLNVPQPDNIYKAKRLGYVFVPWKEIPELSFLKIGNEDDEDWIRQISHVLMKKPLEDYHRDKRGREEEANQQRRESAALTSYLGSPGDPRFVVENSSNYQPRHKMKRD
jgi:hypothetical protein